MIKPRRTSGISEGLIVLSEDGLHQREVDWEIV